MRQNSKTPSLLSRCGARPIVRAEWRRWQPFFIEQIALRTVRPGVSHSNRVRNTFARHNHRFTFDVRLRPMKFAVCPGDRKPPKNFAPCFQSRTRKLKMDSDPVAFYLRRIIYRPRINDLLAVAGAERPERETLTNLCLARGCPRGRVRR